LNQEGTVSGSSTSISPSTDEPTFVWEALAGRLEAFLGAWAGASTAPHLGDFVPAGPPALRRWTLVELIKVDLEQRWIHRKLPRLIEQYVEEFPELAAGGLPVDLVFEEFQIRRLAGDAANPRQYLGRFPQQADQLAPLLGLGLQLQDLTTGLCHRKRPVDLKTGERLDDFDLLAELGKGAFATVFLALQRSMQRIVALKVSADHGTEPQTLAQLEHDFIVRVYDQRVVPERRLRLLYMEHIPGGTLQGAVQRVRQVPISERTGRMLLEAVDQELAKHAVTPTMDSRDREFLSSASWPEAVCWIGARLAMALDYAHRRGVLHRDVKPANVLLTASGSPKLADFNISFSSKLQGATPAAYFGGSLAYMSPEQLEANNPAHPRGPDSLDGRSDIYSLGVLLWELLTGERPFHDEKLGTAWKAMLEELTARRRAGLAKQEVAALPLNCPPTLRRALRTCLATEPDGRYPSASHLARELYLCLRPRTEQLLDTSAHDWRQVARRFPTLSVMIAAVLPNILAAAFNFAYNLQAIVEHLGNTVAAFWNIQTVINGTAFSVGLALVVVLTRPVARTVRQSHVGPLLRADCFASLRRHCLNLGHLAAGVSLALWIIAGIAYPVSIHLAVGDMPPSAYFHFIASLGLCGLVAAAYPFFFVTFLASRAFYPLLLTPDSSHSAEATRLFGLARQAWFYLLLAGSVPLMAVTLLVSMGTPNQFALGVAGAGGLAGLGLAFWLCRTIQQDLEALVPATTPMEDLRI
jgi:serine/threonine protein kinase